MPTYHEIQQKLDDSVEEFFTSAEFQGVMTGYVLVAAHETYVGDRRAYSYETIQMSGSQPPHVTEGLLRMGIRSLEEDLNDESV